MNEKLTALGGRMLIPGVSNVPETTYAGTHAGTAKLVNKQEDTVVTYTVATKDGSLEWDNAGSSQTKVAT